MKPIHLLAGLFGLSMVLLDLVVIAGFEHDYDTPLMLYTGLALGQLALLGLWCALASGPWIARLTTTVLVAGALSHPLGRFTGASWPQWFTLLCIFSALTAGAAVLGRVVGIRRTIGGLQAGGGKLRRPLRLNQFSLGGLLSAMTVVGLALGLGRHFVFPREQALAVAGYGFWLVLIALATYGTLVSRRNSGIRLAALATLCLVAGWFMARTEYEQTVWFFTNVAFLEAIVICTGIGVIQMRWEGAVGGSEVLTLNVDAGHQQHDRYEDQTVLHGRPGS